METKTYQVGFYQGVHGDKDTKTTVSDLLTGWAVNGAPVINIGIFTYKLKELIAHQGTMIQGVIAKFRHNDIPVIGSIYDTERRIELDEEEGLIEKNHFLYYQDKDLLVYQQNRDGSTYGKLAEYITTATGITTVFNPVIQKDALLRLIQGGVKPRKMNVSFARPGDPALLSNHKFNKDLMKLLTDTGGMNMNVTISMGRTKKEYLSMDVFNSISELMGATHVGTAKLEVENEDGVTETVDLITDRIKGAITVKMKGRYPITSDIFSNLTALKSEVNNELKAVLGS